MNGVWIIGIAILVLLGAYIFYGSWLEDHWGINPQKKTPAHVFDGQGEFVKSKSGVVAGHQLSAIAGFGTIQGAVLAASYGWLPALLWFVIGGAFLGGVACFGTLLGSVRNQGKTIGAMVEEYVGTRTGKLFLFLSWCVTVGMMAMCLKLSAAHLSGITGEKTQYLNVYHGSGAMIIMLLIPVALLFGYLNRMGCPLGISTLFLIGLTVAAFRIGMGCPLYLSEGIWVYVLLAYMFIGVLVPVWLLQQSMGYLSGIMIYGLMLAAAIGVMAQEGKMTLKILDTGKDPFWIFPFLCLSAFVASGYSGITASAQSSRQLAKESHGRRTGYGAVLLQCLFGVLIVLAVACLPEGSLEQYQNPLETLEGALLSFVKIFVKKEQWQLQAQIIILGWMGPLYLAFLLSAARTAKNLWCDFFAGKDGKKKILKNPFVGLACTIAVVWKLSDLNLDGKWMVLGAYLFMLAVPVCLCIAVWLKQIGKKSGMFFCFSGICGMISAISFIILLVQVLEEFYNNGNQMYTWTGIGKVLLLLLSMAGIFLFILDGVRAYMKKQKIIFATGNQGKMREIREIMGDMDAQILSMKEAGISLEVEEDGKTFEENAIKKAREIANVAGCIVLADDSGLEVDYLNKEPGIYSARYMGEDTPYSVKNAKLLERLEGVPMDQRTARFVCVIAAAFPDGKILTVRGNMEGYIGYQAQGENGFGYDPIFYPEGYDCSSAQLSMEEKNKISHRGKALRKMKEKLL